MKLATLLLSLFGLTLLTGIMAWLGIGPVVTALERAGLSGFCAIVVGQIGITLGLGVAWYCACPSLGLWHAVAARAVRDAAGNCLPLSQLGGIVIGVRATSAAAIGPSSRRKPIFWPQAVAANLVDITTEVLGQVVFVLSALLCLVIQNGANRFTWPVLGGMGLLTAGIAGFIWTQQRGATALQTLTQCLGRHLAKGWHAILTEHTEAFQTQLSGFWAHPARVGLGAFVHLLLWLAGAGLTWVALSFLNVSISFVGAIAIEGVVCGLMSASFLVPAALGVQEAAYVALGLLFGISAEISLSLSLLRRGRDIAIGIPVLLLWQGRELWRIRRLQPSHAGVHKPSASEKM